MFRDSQMPRTAVVCLLGAALAATMLPSNAFAQQLRYTTTAPGGIASTGNTLGLSKAFNANGPGLEDSIGTFISLSPNSVDDNPLNAANPWPAGTTFDWTQNGSTAVLALPVGAEVLYAELVWSGSYDYVDTVAAFLNDPVTLSFGASSIAVPPAPQTAITIAETSFTGFLANYYIRSADVTTFVQQHEGGSYAVSGVPATQTTTINSLNAAGWSLMVAYRGESDPIRNLSIFVGGSFVDEDSQQDYLFSGFCAPPTGPVEGTVVVSALEGDAELTGDTLLIAESDVGPFVGLAGVNNPASNFFGSQINDESGALDTLGSFGNVNHDAFAGTTVIGGRQGWDLTTVPVSSMDGHLNNGQTAAVIRTNTTGDSFVPTAVAFEIDVKSPDFSGSTTEATPASVMNGDIITVTVTLENSGEAPANGLVFFMPLDSGLDLTTFTTDGAPGDANGTLVAGTQLASGVDAGDLPIGSSRVIEAVVEVVGAPQNGQSFVFVPTFAHSFVVCDGDPPIQESYSPPNKSVSYTADIGGGGAGGDMGNGGGAQGGDMSQGGSGDGNSAGNNSIGEDSGCGCTTPGETSSRGWWLLVGIGLLGLRRRRR